MKSLTIFEEKKQKEKSKNREEIVQIIHTIYLDSMQEKKLYNQLFYAHCQTTITPTKNNLNIKG